MMNQSFAKRFYLCLQAAHVDIPSECSDKLLSQSSGAGTSGCTGSGELRAHLPMALAVTAPSPLTETENSV